MLLVKSCMQLDLTLRVLLLESHVGNILLEFRLVQPITVPAVEEGDYKKDRKLLNMFILRNGLIYQLNLRRLGVYLTDKSSSVKERRM